MAHRKANKALMSQSLQQSRYVVAINKNTLLF